jgi:glycosyltransferase involved in cell wall biosynthesis
MLVLSLLSLVIPCLNEESAIPLFYDEVIRILSCLERIDYEFIFIDDGSEDGTLKSLKELANGNENVHYISFSRNFGKEAAILAGLQKARGDYVAVLDADLQDPPALLPQMLDSVISDGFDCSASRRVTRRNEPRIRSFFARWFYFFMNKISDVEIISGARDFRLMHRKYVNAVLSLTERNRFSKGIFPWVGFKTRWFEYENVQRVSGKTKWSFEKLFVYALDGLMGFSIKPLTIISVFGFILSFLSLIFIGVIAGYKIFLNKSIAGWASTACIILFVGGVQIFAIGILGQYIGKIYTEIKGRPYFIVREEK